MEYKKKEYVASDTVTQAQQALQNQQAAKPGAYQSQYQQNMNNLMGQIQDRPKFQYDVNSDALYQQVAQNYIQQGRNAMMDTMGQAAALTGGYGNSYAQMAGQQAYQGYLQGLADLVPQYQQMAFQQYQAEGEDLLNRYNLMMQQDESAYARYQDNLNQYYANLDRAQSAYESERDYDYGRFADERDFDYGQHIDARNYQYQQERDQASDQQWKESFDYQKSQDDLAYEKWLQEFQYGKDQDQKNWDYKTGQDETAKQKEMAQMMASVGDYGPLAAYYGLTDDQVKKLVGETKTSGTPKPKDDPDDDPYGSGSEITFADVGNQAKNIAATGGDVDEYIAAAHQAGVINKNQYKSLKYTFGY